MDTSADNLPNVRQAVSFLLVADIESPLACYEHGPGFRIHHRWIDHGKPQWCRLTLGNAVLMLQQCTQEQAERIKRDPGTGITIYFICTDALELHTQFKARDVVTAESFDGNNMWVVELTDPDGYRSVFESPVEKTDLKLSGRGFHTHIIRDTKF